MHPFVLYSQILDSLNSLVPIVFWDLKRPIYNESIINEIEDLVDASPIAYKIEWLPSPCFKCGMTVILTNLEV